MSSLPCWVSWQGFLRLSTFPNFYKDGSLLPMFFRHCKTSNIFCCMLFCVLKFFWYYSGIRHWKLKNIIKTMLFVKCMPLQLAEFQNCNKCIHFKGQRSYFPCLHTLTFCTIFLPVFVKIYRIAEKEMRRHAICVNSCLIFERYSSLFLCIIFAKFHLINSYHDEGNV